MNNIFDAILDTFKKQQVVSEDVRKASGKSAPPTLIKHVTNKTLAYSGMHRGTWFKPEYNFDELQIAQDEDSYMGRAIQKKINKLLCAGYEFNGNNAEAVSYIKRRFREFEFATKKPTLDVLYSLYADMFRFSNCMLVKVRDRKASSGKVRTLSNGAEVDPVAALFVLPFETLQFKVKPNGELKKVRQRLPDGQYKDFFPRDLVHFYTNRHPGFAVGTPELNAAMDDIKLLRRIEENVEELIETNLFPVYHYKIGTDTFPERITPEGLKESQVAQNKIEYTPAAGVYVSDHRHEIKSLGSEGKALRIDFYLTYFKNRVLAALGTSALDMGEGTGATKSTASTLSKGMLMDIEAMSVIIKSFFDFHIITELLVEGGFDPLNEDDVVEIKFGVIDKEEKRAQENHILQTYISNGRTIDEFRKEIDAKPWTDDMFERTYYTLFEEPAALLKGMGAGTAASETLANNINHSNITPEAVNKEKKFAEKQNKLSKAGQSGAKPNSSGTGAKRAAASRNKPSNQHGTRSTAKTNRDYLEEYVLKLDLQDVSRYKIDRWIQSVESKFNTFTSNDSDILDLADCMSWRLTQKDS